MTQKIGFYVAAIFFAITAIAGFIADNTTMGIAALTLTIVFGIVASNSKIKSTL